MFINLQTFHCWLLFYTSVSCLISEENVWDGLKSLKHILLSVSRPWEERKWERIGEKKKTEWGWARQRKKNQMIWSPSVLSNAVTSLPHTHLSFTTILQVLSSVKPTPWGVWSLFFWKVPPTLGSGLHSAPLWEDGGWCTELRMEAGDFTIMP